MTHAGIDSLEDVLSRVRRHDPVREKSRGVFHLRSRAFLHFHEDETGVVTKTERARLLREVDARLREVSTSPN